MTRSPAVPQPFLKWAGGKRQLLNEITNLIPNSFWKGKARFYEPFVGGGALMLHLGNPNSTQYVPGNRIYINDINPDLIITYIQVRDNVNKLITQLQKLSLDLTKEAFLDIRKSNPKSEVEIAARFIYLNKTCFNGLWRVNSKGEFNVPWGQFKKPKIFNSGNLQMVSERLQGATISNLPYTTALMNASKGDLVYLDPPYIPLSASSSFSKYSKDGFGLLDQFSLNGVISGLSRAGVLVILSNSDTKLTREVFGEELDLKKVSVQRTISARTSSRNRITELIGTNYNHTSKVMK